MQSRLRTLPEDKQNALAAVFFRLTIVQTTFSGCCDILAQCILVRINYCTYNPFYSLKSSKDIPLLDRMGSKYLCHNRSFILGNRIHWSVNLSSFDKPI